MERRLFPDPRGLALLGSGLWYLLARPGVLAGFVDTYLLAPLQRATSAVYGPVRMFAGRRVLLACVRNRQLEQHLGYVAISVASIRTATPLGWRTFHTHMAPHVVM